MKVKIGDDLPSALVFLDNSNLVQKKDIRDFTVGGKTIIFGLPKELLLLFVLQNICQDL